MSMVSSGSSVKLYYFYSYFKFNLSFLFYAVIPWVPVMGRVLKYFIGLWNSLSMTMSMVPFLIYFGWFVCSAVTFPLFALHIYYFCIERNGF